jgi:TolA-binding protein
MFASQYPQACPGASPNAPCADEALYYLGIEREREGNFGAARKAYQTLLSNHPASRFIPGAHLALGELFLAESGQDASKLAFAGAAYEQALRYPAPDNVLFGYAHHQLGRIRLQQGARARAAASFRAAMAWANAYLSVPGAVDIAASAQRELRALQGPAVR